MSPLKVLSRGYAMTQGADGGVVRSVQQVSVGQQITVCLADGEVGAAVTSVKEAPHG